MKVERRGADRIAPERGQTVEHRLRIADAAQHPEHAPDERNGDSLAQQQIPNALGREAECEQGADFVRALLDAKLKEQRHEDERRENQEEAEPDEQPAEILRLRTGRKRLRPHRLEAEAEGCRFDASEQALLYRCNEVAGSAVCRNGKANGGETSETVCPHLLSGGERDERFWRATIFLPVSLVFIANLMDERKASVPLLRAFGFRQTGEFWHERTVVVGAVHRHDAVDAESIGTLDKVCSGPGEEITEVQRVARLESQVIGQPLVDEDLVALHFRRCPRRASGRNHGIGS